MGEWDGGGGVDRLGDGGGASGYGVEDGFDRDELMALEDARHLAWGYVISADDGVFRLGGAEIVWDVVGGISSFAAVAQALAVVLTGLMAKEIYKTAALRGSGQASGGRWAMVVAALAGVPFCLGAGALMQYISFDYLCWVVVAWGVVKVASGEEKKRREEVEEFKSVRVQSRRATRSYLQETQIG